MAGALHLCPALHVLHPHGVAEEFCRRHGGARCGAGDGPRDAGGGGTQVMEKPWGISGGLSELKLEAHGISLDFIGLIGFSWDFIGLIGFSWDFIGLIGFFWDFIGLIGFSWDFIGFHGIYWA